MVYPLFGVVDIMVKDIKIEDAFNMPGATLVDVRSENEYNEDTIPGAVNIPLLNNFRSASR